MVKRKIILTNDGSTSLQLDEIGETFHSIHGAVQESLHVYIDNGLALVDKKDISVFEFGFGTGLNALLSLNYAQKNHLKLHYETIEAFPLNEMEYKALNFNNVLESDISIQDLHHFEWEKTIKINDDVSFIKHQQFIEDFKSSKTFDIVYFDVFGYDYQPELWDKAILEKAYELLKPNGIFVTYACKGVVNRNLREIGFTVHKTPGPPGKREMIYAVKKI